MRLTMKTVPRLTDDQRLEIQRRVAAGAIFEAAAAAVGCSVGSVRLVMTRTGGMRPRIKLRSALRLSLAEREEISRGLLVGRSMRSIATQLGRSASTVTREVAASGRRQKYRACKLRGRRFAEPGVPRSPSWSAVAGCAPRWSAC